MKAPSVWDLLSPVLLIAIIAQGAALTPSETCQLLKNNTLIADPADCQGLYRCRNGAATGAKCGAGLWFDSAAGSCADPKNVVCHANVDAMCAGSDDVYKIDPTNCEGYCYCKNGVSFCRTCPKGQIYDASAGSCKNPSKDLTCRSVLACLLAPNGLIKNPESSTGWLYCKNGHIDGQGNCVLHFNTLTGSCKYESEEKSSAPKTPGTPAVPKHVRCTAQNIGKLFADGATCRGYFACVRKGFTHVPSWGQCSAGTHFGADTDRCGEPSNVTPVCDYDRCEGMSVSYMTVKGSSCKEYVACSNGKSHTTKCPGNYPYFNEVIQACMKEKPNQAICNMR